MVHEEPFVGVEWVARYLGVSVKTIYRWARTEKIPGYKIGGARKFRRSEVREWAREQGRK